MSMRDEVSFLRDDKNSLLGRFFVILFWVIVGGLLGSNLSTLFNFPNTHDTLLFALGLAAGLGIGAFAAIANSWLAVALAFPAFVFWLLP